MTLRLKSLWTVLSILTVFITQRAVSQGYSQIVIPFNQERRFAYTFNEAENSLILQVENTRPDELSPLYHYDNHLMRRVIFKEQSNQHTQVTMILRDQNVRAAVYSFKEPFRIVVDLFDRRFQESRDPTTGMPLAETSNDNSTRANGNLQSDVPSSMPAITPRQLAMPEPTNSYQNTPSHPSSGKRRLLQPQPQAIKSPEQLIIQMDKVSPGIGSHWGNYPPYIYRIQTDLLKTGKNYKSWLKNNAGRAMSSGEAMADYAAQLYSFGHELKALIGYQKVLYEDPLVFDKTAKHIWNLAEIHLGQGNLTLAQGYYQSLINKHPDSPLSKFSQLRLLDINVQEAISSSKWENLPAIVGKLDLIESQNIPELEAQIAIRHGYWDQNSTQLEAINKDYNLIPTVNPKTLNYLEASRSKAENPKTQFLAATMILNAKLKSEGWNRSMESLAKQYFDTFKGSAAEPFRSQLISESQNNINRKIKDLIEKNQYQSAIQLVEGIPSSLNTITQSSELSWLVAQAYNNLQLPHKAIPYYQKASSLSQNPTDKFNSQFRLVSSIKDALGVETVQNNTTNVKNLTRMLKAEDSKLLQYWSDLSDKVKFEITTKYKDELYQSIHSNFISQSYAEITLWAWQQSFADKQNGYQVPDTWKSVYTATEDDVFLLSKLSKKFLELGDLKKSQTSKDLLKHISPQGFKSKRASKVWADELTELAETYRNNNQYLDAGRIYALTGEKSENWDKRAEALYKGGLLLYRSGRREEAVKAFEQAANDGNNLLYAELAKKRLEQLKE